MRNSHTRTITVKVCGKVYEITDETIQNTRAHFEAICDDNIRSLREANFGQDWTTARKAIYIAGCMRNAREIVEGNSDRDPGFLAAAIQAQTGDKVAIRDLMAARVGMIDKPVEAWPAPRKLSASWTLNPDGSHSITQDPK